MMSDFKSKLPDLKELGEMTNKLFKDVKNSISEIIKDYKEKHPQTATQEEKGSKKEPKAESPAPKAQTEKKEKPPKSE